MKTTIDLPDDLLQEAKIVAAQRRTTLRELVLTGLRHSLAATSADEDAARLDRLFSLLDAGNETPMQALKREEANERTRLS